VQEIHIHGEYMTGLYRVECRCGAAWTGEARRYGVVFYSPAMPVAESVVHCLEEHKGQRPYVTFSPAFTNWLVQHWEQVNLSIAREVNATRR
jgi:hypothetical protein